MAETMKILVVDDSSDIRFVIKSIIEENVVAEVDTAKDGVEAVRRMSDEIYDVVFLDIRMPKLNGLGVLRAIAHGYTLRPFYLALVSATFTYEEKQLGTIHPYVDQLIAKPFRMHEIVGAIEASAMRTGEVLVRV
ncbi:MAG: response regulator [Chloroflexi bacterium]|nr:response regulator [Chloroflexota bacterium]